MLRLPILMLALTSLLLALAVAPVTAGAAGPVITRFAWENNPEFSFDCGTHIITSESDGFGHVKEWFDATGAIQRAQVFLSIDNVITVTRSDGSTQSWADPGRHTDFYTFEDGQPVSQKRAGLTYNVHAPDGGVILHDTGSFVFNFATGELEHTGGPKDFWGIADDFDAVVTLFCTTFA